MKKCTGCNKLKPLSEYYKNGNRFQAQCKECHKEHSRKIYKQKVNTVNQYKSDNGCDKCGDNRHYVLEFHHLDPSQKDYTISDRQRASLSALMDEINKCAILCSNCHREFHHLEREENMTIENYLG